MGKNKQKQTDQVKSIFCLSVLRSKYQEVVYHVAAFLTVEIMCDKELR